MNIANTPLRWLPVLVVLVVFVIQIPLLNAPPQGTHFWRKCLTLSVARNFYEESMNPLKPRLDCRFDSDGVTGMQFPSYEYGLALLYHVTGEHYYVQRLYAFLLYVLFVAGVFYLSRFLFTADTGALTAAAAAAIPEEIFWSMSALPDTLAITAAVWGMYYALLFFSRLQVNYLIVGVLLFTISALTKAQYFLVVAIAPLLWQHRQSFRLLFTQQILFYAIACSFAFGVVYCWYSYSRTLIQTSAVQLIDLNLISLPQNDRLFQVLARNFYADIPLMLAGSVMSVLAVWIFIREVQHKSRYLFTGFAAFIIVFTFHLMKSEKTEQHAYYLWVYLLLIIPVLAFVFNRLLYSRFKGKYLSVFGAGLLLNILLVSFRLYSTNELPRKEYLDTGMLGNLRSAVNDTCRCITGPDQTSCVDLFFLHKKGYNIPFRENANRVDGYIRSGAGFLYSADSLFLNDSLVKPHLSSLILQEGNMRVYRLR
jgi:hypothetical protein